MPLPSGTVRIVLSGTLAGGEIFSCGFQLRGDGGWSQNQLDAAVGVAGSSLASNFLTTATLANFPTTTSFRRVQGYLYAGGTSAVRQSEATFAVKTGTASGVLPNQLALVVTLNTGRPGRSFRGRMYLPGPAAIPLSSTDGQMIGTNLDGLCTTLQGCFQGIRDGAGGAPVVVASSKQGAMTTVTAIKIDSKVDTQRSRAQTQQILRSSVRTI